MKLSVFYSFILFFLLSVNPHTYGDTGFKPPLSKEQVLSKQTKRKRVSRKQKIKRSFHKLKQKFNNLTTYQKAKYAFFITLGGFLSLGYLLNISSLANNVFTPLPVLFLLGGLLGHKAKKEMKASGDFRGKGFANAAMIIGLGISILGVAVTGAALLYLIHLVLSFPGFSFG